MKEREGGSN